MNHYARVCNKRRSPRSSRGGGGLGWLPSVHHRSYDWESASGGVCIWGSWVDPPKIHGILRDTVNKREVPILLDCILVIYVAVS